MNYTLDDFNDDVPSGPNEPTWTVALHEDAQPFADDSCPWCAAPAETFRVYENGKIGCPRSHQIPVDEKWYQRGRKVFFR